MKLAYIQYAENRDDTHDEACESLRRALVDVDAADTTNSASVPVEEPDRVIARNGEDVVGDGGAVASIAEAGCEAIVGFGQIDPNTRCREGGLHDAVIALSDYEIVARQ